jgi:hypothetical protein
VFPGGRLSSLLEALDYCLERGIDIVNLSLGTLQPSQGASFSCTGPEVAVRPVWPSFQRFPEASSRNQARPPPRPT